jgi:hypothetical protein
LAAGGVVGKSLLLLELLPVELANYYLIELRIPELIPPSTYKLLWLARNLSFDELELTRSQATFGWLVPTASEPNSSSSLQ